VQGVSVGILKIIMMLMWCRRFLSQYHEKDMERLQQKLKQKEEEQARQEERRINQLEKVSYLKESLIRLSVPLDFGADEFKLEYTVLICRSRPSKGFFFIC
jgi:hypothetical protein